MSKPPANETGGNLNNDEKTQILRTLRRKVMAAMETGQHDIARTVIRELREYDLQASRALRAEVVAAYGIDI